MRPSVKKPMCVSWAPQVKLVDCGSDVMVECLCAVRSLTLDLSNLKPVISLMMYFYVAVIFMSFILCGKCLSAKHT